MARFSTAAVAVSFFCLLTLTFAGDPTENVESSTQVVSLPVSESANPALRLPTEPVKTETESNSAAVSSVPLKRITFKPINRRFHVRPKHPCRHHFGFYPKMRENVEVPYGNDMLVASGENSDFQEPVLHGEGLRIPGGWVMHPHHHLKHDDDSDSDDEDEDRMKKFVFKRYDHNMLDGEKKLKKLRKRYLNAGEEKKKKGGFMKRVRKFLDHYF